MKINLAKFKDLKSKRLLSSSDISNICSLGVKTVRRLESGKTIRIKTVHDLFHGLGIGYEEAVESGLLELEDERRMA